MKIKSKYKIGSWIKGKNKKNCWFPEVTTT